MQTLQIELGGQKYDLAATWGASLEIEEQVADPLFISGESFKKANFDAVGVDYDPKFSFGTRNSVRILHIALKHNGHDVTEEQIGDALIKVGMLRGLEWAADYIGLIVNNGPSEELPKGKKETPQAGDQ